MLRLNKTKKIMKHQRFNVMNYITDALNVINIIKLLFIDKQQQILSCLNK